MLRIIRQSDDLTLALFRPTKATKGSGLSMDRAAAEVAIKLSEGQTLWQMDMIDRGLARRDKEGELHPEDKWFGPTYTCPVTSKLQL